MAPSKSKTAKCLNPSCPLQFGFSIAHALENEHDSDIAIDATTTTKNTGRKKAHKIKRRKTNGIKTSAEAVAHMITNSECNVFSNELYQCHLCQFKCVALCTARNDLSRHMTPLSTKQLDLLKDPLPTEFDFDTHDVSNADLNTNYEHRHSETAPAGLFSEYAESQDISSQISGVLPHSCIDLTPDYLTDLTGRSSLRGVIAKNNYTDIHVFDEESVVIRRSGRTTKVPSKYQQPDVTLHDSSSSRSPKSINHPGNNQVTAGEETNINYNNSNDESEDDETYPRDLDQVEGNANDIDISWGSRDNVEVDISCHQGSMISSVHNLITSASLPHQRNIAEVHISDMVKCIAQHRRDVSIVPKSYLPYLELFIKLSKPGIASSTYDSIKHSLHKNFLPTTSIENGISYGIEAPSAKKLTKWVQNIVHPSKYIDRSKSTVSLLKLPSGRSVNLVTNDIRYQISLLLSDKYLMHPDNLIYVDKNNPFVDPENDCPLGEINTGSVFKNASRFIWVKHGDLVFPIIFFIDLTLVTRHGVEPIFITFGIFKLIIRNNPRAWFLAGYIQPDKNYSSLKVNQTYGMKEKLNDYHAIVDFILKDLTDLSNNGGFQYDLKMSKDIFPVTYKPVIQLAIADCKDADVLCGRFGCHAKKVK